MDLFAQLWIGGFVLLVLVGCFAAGLTKYDDLPLFIALSAVWPLVVAVALVVFPCWVLFRLGRFVRWLVEAS
jgi:hypothetical protein